MIQPAAPIDSGRRESGSRALREWAVASATKKGPEAQEWNPSRRRAIRVAGTDQVAGMESKAAPRFSDAELK